MVEKHDVNQCSYGVVNQGIHIFLYRATSKLQFTIVETFPVLRRFHMPMYEIISRFLFFRVFPFHVFRINKSTLLLRIGIEVVYITIAYCFICNFLKLHRSALIPFRKCCKKNYLNEFPFRLIHKVCLKSLIEIRGT
jgi:hypothetical protein